MTAQAYTGVDVLEVMAEAENYNAFLLDQIIASSGGARTAVDFGAGMGTFAGMVRDRGLEVTCIEPDAGLRDHLSARGLANHPSIAALPPASADFIYSLNVLEHIEDDLAALRDIHAAMRPGGRFYIYVPAFDVLRTSLDDKVGHFRRYTKPLLTTRLAQAGFAIERARYVDCLGFPAALAFKVMDDGSCRLNTGMVRLYDRVAFPASRLLDTVFSHAFGKNLAVLARRPA